VLIRSVAVNDAPIGKPITTTMKSQQYLITHNFIAAQGTYVISNRLSDDYNINTLLPHTAILEYLRMFKIKEEHYGNATMS
jgi:hypothetical protein